MTTEELAKIRADYEAAREMREFSAAKRINFEDYGEGLTADRWFVVKGKDTSCFGEGTPNHWRWAAMILLGLASPDDAPHAEEKPTPEIVPMLLDEIERLRADAARRFVLIHRDGYDSVFVVPFGCEAKARKHIKAWEEWDQSMANACGRPRRIEDAGPEPLRPEWLLEVDLSKDKLTVAIPQVTRGN